MNRKQLIKNLKSMNINDAVTDTQASADNSPAILLRWNGQEEYYTGFYAPEYEEWLKQEFSDK